MPANALGPGSIIASRFRLEDLLEEHSGARFWRATDLALARNVSCHLLASDDPRADRLLAAARRSATVSDPRLLRVLDALHEDGYLAVVHEWSTGASLDLVLDPDPVDPRRAAWLVQEVAEALTVAHQHGVPHGRLLPENVMVNDAGAVKLIGFAVSAALDGAPEDAAESTPDLSAPALAAARARDVRDLGALLYACLVGRWPGSPGSSLPAAPTENDRVLRPRRVRAGVPRPLDDLCDRLLAPAGTRPSLGAGTVAAALADFLADRPMRLPAGDDGEATALIDVRGLAGVGDAADGRPADSASAAWSGSTPDDTEATQHLRLDDPEATQAAGFAALRDNGENDVDATRQVPPLPDAAASGPSTPSSTPSSTPPSTPPSSPPPRAGAWPLSSSEIAAPAAGRAVPRNWGPDPARPVVPVPPEGRDEEEGPGRWIRLGGALAAVLLIVIAAVVAFDLGSGGDPDADDPGDDPSGTPAGKVLEVAGVRDFDPDQDGGSPEENPEDVPLTIDGDPATAWTTLTYRDGPPLAPYKSGVGLVVDLGETREVSEVQVTLAGGPHDLQLLAAPTADAEPTSIEGLDTLDTQASVDGEVVLAPDDTTEARYLVVWLTALPPTDGGFRGSVAEIVVRS